MSDTTYSPSPATGAYEAPAAAGAVHATLTIPGSKSLTNRELMIAAIADGPGRLIAPLHSDDSRRMIDALRALGIRIDEVEGGGEFGPDLVVTPGPLRGGTTIDCGQAGTVMRFVTPLAGLAAEDVHLTAHESALHRPMGAMITTAMNTAVRNAWYTVSSARRSSPAPTARATSTLIPVKIEEMNTITMSPICMLTPIAAFPV